MSQLRQAAAQPSHPPQTAIQAPTRIKSEQRGPLSYVAPPKSYNASPTYSPPYHNANTVQRANTRPMYLPQTVNAQQVLQNPLKRKANTGNGSEAARSPVYKGRGHLSPDSQALYSLLSTCLGRGEMSGNMRNNFPQPGSSPSTNNANGQSRFNNQSDVYISPPSPHISANEQDPSCLPTSPPHTFPPRPPTYYESTGGAISNPAVRDPKICPNMHYKEKTFIGK